MQKNDKIIVILGVIILILASIGIYYWAPTETEEKIVQIGDFFNMTGVMNDMPGAIAISDSNPFYALIATPVAINYDSQGEQNVIPLYIKNFEDPSSAIVRTEELIGLTANEFIKDSISEKNASLYFAKKYWESSEGVIIIENTQNGYNLGVLATPFASYLSIPVIVTDKIDGDVRTVLSDLKVKRSIVCGDGEGYGDILRFNNPDDIVNASIELVRQKFDNVNYITISNPIDAHEPEVLDYINLSFSGTVSASNKAPSRLISAIKSGGARNLGQFTIPGDYKYALIKFEGTAKYMDGEDPEEFGSSVSFTVKGPSEIFGIGLNTAGGGIPIRDANGNIITDRVYAETVVYDYGGKEYSISAGASLFVTDSAKATANVSIEKLSDPLYPMMKKLSATAPYLTAYRKGIIFGKPEFAFVADDNIRTLKDETCPGYYQPRMNNALLYASNKHVFWIHDQINELLARLADININEIDGLAKLKNYYETYPIYIALVGDTVVLPQIIFDNYLLPPGDTFSNLYGVGIPTDVMYGNIDPIRDDWSNTANDIYNDLPFQENIVGRIVGWDIQDVSALVTRTLFYNRIIDELGDWKNKATVQTGCGTDFLRPPIPSIIQKIKGSSEAIIKWPSGQTSIVGDALQKIVLEPLGFEVYRTEFTASQAKGFSDAAIKKMKTTNLLSRLLFGSNMVRLLSGKEHVKGGQYMQECNIIWQNAHGWPNGYTSGDIVVHSLGYKPLIYAFINYCARSGVLTFLSTGLGGLGQYNTRNIDSMKLGPSIMIIESCFTGKIDGIYPKLAISLTPIHSGINALIASPTETNVPGGYLEPYLEKGIKWDKWNIIGRIIAKMNVKKGIYPDFHFGPLFHSFFYKELGKDKDVGTSLRNARNEYLPKDIESTFKWVPPLGEYDRPTSAKLAPNVPEHKYMAYYEYLLYGDPAFNPYVPNE